MEETGILNTFVYQLHFYSAKITPDETLDRSIETLGNNNNNLYSYWLTLTAATAVTNREAVQYYKLLIIKLVYIILNLLYTLILS